MAQAAQERVSGLRKAAVLMVVLGDKAASSIYKHLSQAEVEELTREIAQVAIVPHDTAVQVLEEFNKLALTRDYLARGGYEYAHRLLVNAFGEPAAKDLLRQVMRGEEVSLKDLDVIQKADPQLLAKLIQGEHPQTIALLLAHLGSKMSSALLNLLPQELTAQVVERLAKLRQVSPEMVQQIVSVLHRKLQGLGKQNRLAYGGINAVAELLNRLETPTSSTILESIERQDQKLAMAIRNQMFTFADFLNSPEASIRDLLAQVDKKTLALALKGAPVELKGYFLKAMSSRAAEMLNEDIDSLSAVRSRDVLQAQQEIVQTARSLEAAGKIVLKSEGDDTYV